MAVNQRFSIEEFNSPLQDIMGSVDLFVYAVGFEQRSSHFVDIAHRFPAQFAAVVYENHKTHGHSMQNQRKFKERGHDKLGPSERQILSYFVDFVKNKERPQSIVVDISCLDRSSLSMIVMCILASIRTSDNLYVIYTPNDFLPPDVDFPPMQYFGPAIPQVSGNVGNTKHNRCLIMGLGYEYGSSLNVLEQLEPSVTYLYRPIGYDTRFIESVAEANFNYDFGETNVHIDDYYLGDMVSVYRDLSSIVLALKHDMTITLVPFGPKIFSFVCLLIALENVGDVALLRYSVSNHRTASELKASGKVCGLLLRGIDNVFWGRALERGR